MTNMRSSEGLAGARAAAFLLGISIGLAGAIGPAAADKVGVAAAVNPDAFSSLSQTPSKQLNIGKSIFYNERINTTGSGLVQVLLIDGSTFTVGPNSDLIIDRFVYDPNKKSGQIVASFSKGTMRFIGGKISKNEGGVTVKTPAGALAIRGGMFDARVSGNRSLFAFRYGVSLSYVGNNGVRKEIFEQGYLLDLTGGNAIVREVTAEDTALFQQSFSGGGTVVVPGQDNQPPPNTQSFETVSLQDLISDANATQVDSTLQQEETNETPTDDTNNNPPPNNTNNNPPPDNTGNNPPPPPEPFLVQTRVLNPAGVYTAFPGTDDEFTTDQNQSVLGGDPNANVDDFNHTFSIVDGRLVGIVSGLTDSFLDENGNVQVEDLSDAAIDFPATFPGTQCDNLGVCIVTDATITQEGKIDNYVGRFVGRDGFFAYHVARGEIDGQDVVIDLREPEPILAFGGTAYDFGTPTGKVYAFALTPDVLANSPAPFSSAESMPEEGFVPGATAVSPLLLLTKDSDNPDSQAVWLQTSFYIGDSSGDDGYGQQSFINIALGGISEDGGLIGARRGGAQVSTLEYYDGPGCQGEGHCYGLYNDGSESYAFTGDIASLASPDGDHFLGTDDPNIVIGIDSTDDAHNIARDIPLDPTSTSVEDQSGATYHVGIGIGSFEPATQQGGTFQGYAAGFAQQPGDGAPTSLVSNSPNDVTLSLDAASNTMTASLEVGNGMLLPNPRYNLEFGGGEGNSAYIDDNIFAALENPSASTVDETVLVPHTITVFGKEFTVYKPEEQTYEPDVQGYFVSADAIQANEQLFPGETVIVDDVEAQKRAFCQNCNYIKWGAWGARLGYENYDGQQVTENVHLGWWIAGDVVSESDMPITGNATYNGDAIGTVASKLQNGGWDQYVATGDMNMNWDFAKRSGMLRITDFDNKNFSGPMFAPGKANFGGPLGNLNAGIIGTASGSFVGSPGSKQIPNGVIGNFGVGNIQNTWKANGIFGGTRVP